MEKYVIYDATANSNKNYISNDSSNVELIENARLFDSEEEALQLVDDNHWNDWAEVIPVETQLF